MVNKRLCCCCCCSGLNSPHEPDEDECECHLFLQVFNISSVVVQVEWINTETPKSKVLNCVFILFLVWYSVVHFTVFRTSC